MANVDPNYREWQSRAARKIVEQFRDGTLEVVAKRGAELSDGRMTVDECMARQIVGILLAHQVNEPAQSVDDEQHTLMGRPIVSVDMPPIGPVEFRAVTPQDAQNVLRPQILIGFNHWKEEPVAVEPTMEAIVGYLKLRTGQSFDPSELSLLIMDQTQSWPRALISGPNFVAIVGGNVEAIMKETGGSKKSQNL